MKALVALVAVAVAAAVLIAVGTGGSDDSPEQSGPGYHGVGQVRAGSVAPLAQCSDWNEGTEEQKRATVTDIYNQINQSGADGPTPDLPADEAYDLFERLCSNDYAVGFRLYKFYVRAAAFRNIAP